MSIECHDPQKGDLVILSEGLFFQMYEGTIGALGLVVEVEENIKESTFYSFPDITTKTRGRPSGLRRIIAMFKNRFYAVSFFVGEAKFYAWHENDRC